MEKFKSHKIVEAELLDHFDGDTVVLVSGERIDLTPKDHTRIGAMIKEGGGYLVRYSDGYLSWSPKQAFDEGYTKVMD